MARFRKSDKTDALARIGLFEGLSKKELGFVAQMMTEATFPEGTQLVTQGELGLEAMIIMDGSAVVRRNNRKIDDMGPGDVLGEMSLINHVPRNATVTATSSVTVFIMDAREFASVMSANEGVAVKLLKTVAARLATAESPAV